MTTCVLYGFGQIAEKGHLPTLREHGVDVAAAVDVSPERREAAQDKGLSTYDSLEEALDREEPDLLDVAVPPAFKLGGVEAAASRGIDVLVEKPVCMPGEQDRLRVLGEEVRIVPVHNYLHAPHFRRLKELAGDASEVSFEVKRTGYCRGSECWEPEWRVDPEISGGGILMDHGYHAIYISNYLVGRMPEGVELLEMEMEMQGGVDILTRFRLNYDEGAASAVVSLDWTAEERSVTVRADDHVLRDDYIEDGERFGHGLSDGSIHREWFGGVLDALNGEETDSLLKDAVTVMDVVEELYRLNKS